MAEPEPLLNNLKAAGFWDAVAESRPLHVPQVLKGLRGLLDIDELLAVLRAASNQGNVSSHKRGEKRTRENYQLAYLDHAALIVASAERYLPRLLTLCSGFVPSFDYVTARLVLVPPSCPPCALLASGDTLAVQLWGEVRLAALPSSISTPRKPGETEEPLLVASLRPGDVLYIPQSVDCRPVARSSHSPPVGQVLYAVFTLRDQAQTLGVVLNRYISDALRSDVLSAETNRFCRTSFTRRDLQRNTADCEGLLQQATKELAQSLSPDVLRKELGRRMEELRQSQRDGVTETEAPPPGCVTSQTVVRIARGVQCRCKPGESVAFFKRGTETLALPIAPTASHLVNALSSGQGRLVASLPCDDAFERVCVCQVLVYKETLEIVAPENGGGSGGGVVAV